MHVFAFLLRVGVQGLTLESIKATNLRVDDGQFRKELLRTKRRTIGMYYCSPHQGDTETEPFFITALKRL
jgi:hypothetical protein